MYYGLLHISFSQVLCTDVFFHSLFLPGFALALSPWYASPFLPLPLLHSVLSFFSGGLFSHRVVSHCSVTVCALLYHPCLALLGCALLFALTGMHHFTSSHHCRLHLLLSHFLSSHCLLIASYQCMSCKNKSVNRSLQLVVRTSASLGIHSSAPYQFSWLCKGSSTQKRWVFRFSLRFLIRKWLWGWPMDPSTPADPPLVYATAGSSTAIQPLLYQHQTFRRSSLRPLMWTT